MPSPAQKTPSRLGEGVRAMYSQTEMIFQAHQSRSSAMTALTNL